MINEQWLQCRSAAALALNKRVNLSFEALNPGIDFSSPAMEVLDGIQYMAVVSTVKIWRLV